MKFRKTLLVCCVALSAGFALTGTRAEDVDLFVNNTAATDPPNVLLVLDNAANFSASISAGDLGDCKIEGAAPSLGQTFGAIEQCAIYNAVKGLTGGSALVNIGVMVYNDTGVRNVTFNGAGGWSVGTECGGRNGGCLVVPLVSMADPNNKASMLAWLRDWTNDSKDKDKFVIKGSGQATGAVMQEVWAYFAGNKGLSGRSYASIKPTDGCQKNFVIFVGNAWGKAGTPDDSGSVNNVDITFGGRTTTGVNGPQAALAAVTTDATLKQIASPVAGVGACAVDKTKQFDFNTNHEARGFYADEWTRYLWKTDRSGAPTDTDGIKTYTIGLVDQKDCTDEYPSLMNSMATLGGGLFYSASNYTEIFKSITEILNEVQAVNSVFTSASLPVSVNAQGTYLNQVFFGQFRPDANAAPRWLGNLKQYQLVKFEVDKKTVDPSGFAVNLVDKDNQLALSTAGTGFFSNSAVSFWTKTSVSTSTGMPKGFFEKDPKGTPPSGDDSPDGPIVEKGGVAQQLRSALLTAAYPTATSSTDSTRRLYTNLGCESTPCVLADRQFNAANIAIKKDMLGVSTEEDRLSLINWVRGQNNADEKSQAPAATVTVRPSIHGDVVHSRPTVISYNDTRGLVAFYGANSGVFHAVNGSQNAKLADPNSSIEVDPGGELWGLVLAEHFNKLKRLRDNAPKVRFLTTSPDAVASERDYFVDGPVGTYIKYKADTNDATKQVVDKAYLYLAMRRGNDARDGSRFIVALDVSQPFAPSILWTISSRSSDFAELGQTWSAPQVVAVKGYPSPVVVFGGGYSPAQDFEPPKNGNSDPDRMGRAIYVVDAITGNLVWRASPGDSACDPGSAYTGTACAVTVSSMTYPIPSDLGLFDRDGDGYVERLYVGDLGGQVWRVDLEPSTGNTPNKWKVSLLASVGCNAGACTSGSPRKFFYPPSFLFFGQAGATGSYDLILMGSGDREHPLDVGRNATNALVSLPANCGVPTTTSDSIGPRYAYCVTNRFYAFKDAATKAGAVPSGDAILDKQMFDATKNAWSTNSDATKPGYYITLAQGEKVVNASLTVRGSTFFGTNKPSVAAGDTFCAAPKAKACAAPLGAACSYKLDPFEGTAAKQTFDGGGFPPSPVFAIVGGVKTGQLVGTEVKLLDTQVDSLVSVCFGCGQFGTRGDGQSAVGGSSVGLGNLKKNLRRNYWFER